MYNRALSLKICSKGTAERVSLFLAFCTVEKLDILLLHHAGSIPYHTYHENIYIIWYIYTVYSHRKVCQYTGEIRSPTNMEAFCAWEWEWEIETKRLVKRLLYRALLEAR